MSSCVNGKDRRGDEMEVGWNERLKTIEFVGNAAHNLVGRSYSCHRINRVERGECSWDTMRDCSNY